MIRYTLLALFIAGLIRYAWQRDWCKSLCGLVAMLAVLERPDMPKAMFGLNGLNPFNFALLGIGVGWVRARRREPNSWDVPMGLTVLLGLYVLITIVSTTRLFLDPSYLVIWQRPDLEVRTMGSLIGDYGVNTFKWLLPPALLLHGCRTEERYRWVIFGVLGMYAVLALLVIRQMPLGYLLDGEALQQRAANILQRRVGYHRVDLATMFSGAAWAMLAARPLFESKRFQMALVGLFGITTLGLALTGGRTGYATWVAVGLVMAVLKWRKHLLLAPVLLIAVLIVAPAVPQRLLQGLTGGTNEALVTSGRNMVWPFVIDKIRQAPFTGFGRQAWVRTNLRLHVTEITGENFGHPHNAYLEFTLDNGLIGLAILVPLLLLVIWRSVWMFRSPHPTISAAGGVSLAMTLSYMIASLGAETFYPREGAVGMWCFIALSTRVAWDLAAKTKQQASPAVPRVPAAGAGWRRPNIADRVAPPASPTAVLRPGTRVRQWPR